MPGPRGRKAAHAYDPAEISRLRTIQLLPKVKCGRCDRNLPLARFSEKQLTDARYQVLHYGDIQKPISCQNCTGAQITEIECTFCFKWKGLEDFAKSQRANANTARCFKCTDEQVTRQPIKEEPYEEEKPFITPDFSGGVAPEYWKNSGSMAGTSTNGDWDSFVGKEKDDDSIQLPRQFQAMSVNGSVPETLIDTEDSVYGHRLNSNPHGDGRSEAQSRSWCTESAGTTNGASTNKNGTATAISKAGTERTLPSTYAERSVATSDGSCGSFHGASGYVRPPPVRPSGDARAEIKEDADPWSDDDSDGGEGRGDSDDESDGDNTVI
ncbi:Stc1 domain-containing protein [Paraphoma chrysanthemicola]|uniref:Stc1 domain-containing protein n=1 Tax=Paraphoma chrysanthemicola TaxID=798071 RepID=A0A8K0W0W3_9PLEO|nr:Stc1 domain-containing protein [Paraphoma chrysanthemicola]